jgi:hypothetical protein
MNRDIDTHDTAVFLQWAGFALIVIYGVTVVVELLPLALFKPAWLVGFSGKVLGGGAFALIGAVMLVMALHFDAKVLPLSRLQKRLRQLARLAALGFLLLIPLQAFAGIMVWKGESQDVQQRLGQLEKATVLISKANSESALIQGLSQLPGAPKVSGQKLSVPVPVLKSQVLAQLNRQIPLLETQTAALKKLRLEAGVAQWFKQGVISGAYATAFWMLAGIRDRSQLGSGANPMPLAPRPIPVSTGGRPRRIDDLSIPPEWLEGPEPSEQSTT